MLCKFGCIGCSGLAGPLSALALLATLAAGSRFVSHGIVQQALGPRNQFLVSEKTEVHGVDADDPEALELAADTDFESPVLFRAIVPADVVQGDVGDCWIAATMASMARFPRAVQRLFREQTLAADGMYHLQLYDPGEQAWVNISVDDKVPFFTAGGYRYPKNMRISFLYDLWPMLLEKAFAKVMSSFSSGRLGYEGLRRGVPSWALAALTGSSTQWRYTSKGINDTFPWTKKIMNVSVGNLVLGTEKGQAISAKALERVSHDGLWAVLVEAMKRNWLMTSAIKDDRGSTVSFSAGSEGHLERERTDRLHSHHDYSILAVEQLSRGSHQVCVKTVTVRYTSPGSEELQNDKTRLDERLHFRGWAPGDRVWAYTTSSNSGKSQRPIRMLVKQILNSSDCLGEQCVELSASDSSDVRTVPMSWVVGRRQWGWAEQHGVRMGWKLISYSADWRILTFEGVVDRSICEESRLREAEYRDHHIGSLGEGELLRLVKVRNPWGNFMTYTGKWSNSDTTIWEAHRDIAEALAFRPTPDGTTWIEFGDFARKFSSVSISPVDMASFDPPPLR
eukprot:gnl/TRDRNA2_/TRDRNA2_179857_c0_seq1.p1 gnl/TRDRNA2_/TRDRNA2_179857_c0~~gnl/TRDRNA2_/TRDRNA2_179857_c0_seq1.p1  ORF type:complete len:564 (-),score=82.33 gnl/TRDRNA2_/TRDRNA2_179857_c0_seq1:152-1843(-)